MSNIVEYILGLKSDQFQSGIAAAEASTDSLTGKIQGLGAIIGVSFGLAGIAAFTRSMVEAGSKVEDAQVGLTTLLKNASEAKKVIQNTMEDATKTPFAFSGLLAANKALISADETATGARSAVLNLANAIAATGGGDDELQRMVINLQQIKNVGFASALDLKQFAYAGINLYKVLDQAGIKHGKNQQITYERITEALATAHNEGGIYFNGLENMAGNTSVQISNLGDALFQLKVQMFEDLKPAISSVISGLSSFISTLKTGWEWVVIHKDGIKELAKGIGAAYIAFKAMTIVPAIIAGVTYALEGLVLVGGEAAVATTAFGAAVQFAMGPVGWITLAIGGLVTAYEMLTDAQRRHEEQNAKDTLDSNKALENSYVDRYAKLEKKSGLSHAAFVASEKKRIDQTEKEITEYNANALRNNQPLKDVAGLLTARTALERFAKPSASGTPAPTTKGLSGAASKPSKDSTVQRAQGAKSVTINVSIKEFGAITLNTTTIKESVSRIREQLNSALQGSINDFQLVADH